MRCVAIEEWAVVSGGGNPSGCKSDIISGSGIGVVVGTAVGSTIGAFVGTLVAGPAGTGTGLAYGGALGSEIGLLAGGALAGAYSSECATADSASSDGEFIDPWSGEAYASGSGPWDYDPGWMW